MDSDPDSHSMESKDSGSDPNNNQSNPETEHRAAAPSSSLPETPTPSSRQQQQRHPLEQSSSQYHSIDPSSSSPQLQPLTPTRRRITTANPSSASLPNHNLNFFGIGIGNPPRTSNANSNQASPARSRAQITTPSKVAGELNQSQVFFR